MINFYVIIYAIPWSVMKVLAQTRSLVSGDEGEGNERRGKTRAVYTTSPSPLLPSPQLTRREGGKARPHCTLLTNVTIIELLIGSDLPSY